MLLGPLDDLPEGTARGFDPAGEGRDAFFVVRSGGRLYAWRNACPHQDGAPMAWRQDAYLSADRRRIVCSAHGARFDIASGVCLLGPCLGEALTPVPIQIGADGAIHIIE